MTEEENETWLLNMGGGIIEKKAEQGYASLTPIDKLIYCFWATDYSMRNAGDLLAAGELHAGFREDARLAAKELRLPRSILAFSLSCGELKERYFDLFDDLCREIKAALPYDLV